jgi:phosphoglycerol transferase
MPTVLTAPPERAPPATTAAQMDRKGAVAPSRKRALLAGLVGYSCVALLSCLALARIMRLGQADWSVPWCEGCDALMMQVWLKGIAENGWYLTNPSLGAPGGMSMHDFPMADNLHFFLLKLLVMVTHNVPAAANLYYVLGFPAAAVAAAAMMRALGVSWLSAAVAGVLYSLLPYHFIRHNHLCLASYYLVPPAVLVAVWLNLDRLRWPWSRDASANGGRWRFYTSAAILLLTSAAGVYYAFFTCYLLVVAAAVAAINGRTFTPAIFAATLVALTSAGVLVNLSPSLLYWRQHGANPEVAHRPVDDTEHLGLKIGQLVLPAPRHRLPRLAEVRAKYDELILSAGEQQGAALGAVGTCGFLFLVGLLVYRRPMGDEGRICNCLAAFNLSCVLLATLGGFGSLFSLLVNPSIRAYNRMSIFIALFALVAVAILFDRLRAWWLGKGGRSWPVVAVGALVLAAGVSDQVGRGYAPNYASLAAEFRCNADFVSQIEDRLEPGAMVFQFPYYPFPEFPGHHLLRDYQLFRPYLHSRWLRFSYGAMKGRIEDRWQRVVSAMPVDEQVRALEGRGFRGIMIDRNGYADGAAGLEAALTSLVGPTALVSADGRLSFFPLPKPAEEVEPAELATAQPPLNPAKPQ